MIVNAENDAYSQGLSESFSVSAEANNIDIPTSITIAPTETSESASLMSKLNIIKSTGSRVIYMIVGANTDAVKVIKAAKALGMTGEGWTWVGCDAWLGNTLDGLEETDKIGIVGTRPDFDFNSGEITIACTAVPVVSSSNLFNCSLIAVGWRSFEVREWARIEVATVAERNGQFTTPSLQIAKKYATLSFAYRLAHRFTRRRRIGKRSPHRAFTESTTLMMLEMTFGPSTDKTRYQLITNGRPIIMTLYTLLDVLLTRSLPTLEPRMARMDGLLR